MKPCNTSVVPRWRAAALGCVAAALLALTGVAQAQDTDEPAAGALTGVLKRIRSTGVVHLGYRERAIPFSYEGPDGRPYGYSIDLCQAIVEDIAQEIGAVPLRTEYRRVTPVDRIEQVVDGRVDLECGATTNTAQRREQVAFSPLIFVAGTRLLVRRGGPVRSWRDLAGRQVVAVVRGTTNEEAMRALAARQGRPFAVVTTDDYAQAVAKLGAGEVAAVAADDILLAGYVAEQKLQTQFAVVGELLSYEPYGLMFARGDPALAAVVERTFRRLATTRELRWIYDRWFVRAWPSGTRLSLPMGVELTRAFQLLGLPPD